MLSDDKIGARIECDNYYGTIRYVGPVEDYQGLWLGIDWDDPSRGKHNGTINGVHYFDTSLPTSGSFVRKEKVNFGKSIIKSIKSRYGAEEDVESVKQKQQQLLRFQKDINAPFLEMVGFEKVANKQKNFHSLQIVNARCENINTIGAPDELRSLCPNLRELDISKNLLSSWEEIFKLCSQLEHLTWLNVSENLLVIPKNYKDYNFPKISVLICNGMNLNWNDVLKILHVFPNITELRIAFNKITDLTTDVDNSFKCLSYLDLEGNDIKFWLEIMKLSVIENLEHLMIENIKLDKIIIENEDDFPHLNSLNINNNLIAEWRSVSELNKLKNLEHLRFKNNPVLKTEKAATSHQIIIAKIKNLKTLNGTFIEREERKGAEYDYIKIYAKEWLKVKDNAEERHTFLETHNRYLDLIEECGFPEDSELEIKKSNIETTLVTLKFILDDKTVEKSVPPTLQVQKLTILAQKLFKLKTRPSLSVVRSCDIVIKLDDDLKEIGYYSVQCGDTILVEKEI